MIEEILMYFFNKVMYILNEYKNLNMAYKLVHFVVFPHQLLYTFSPDN